MAVLCSDSSLNRVNAWLYCCNIVTCIIPSTINVGYLILTVEEKYNPGNAVIMGSCENLERRAEGIDKTVFGTRGTFRNTTECREMVYDYMCLW